MWYLLCLIVVALVGASYQRTLIPNDSDGGHPSTLDQSVLDDHPNRWRNVSNTERPTAFDKVVESIAEKKICPPCTCGARGKKLGIIGGNSTYVNEYPWMALLLYKGGFMCGGSLINDRYVLTAAHCVAGKNKKKFVVRLLEHDRSTTNESKSEEYKVLKVIIHEDYYSLEYGNDIALLRLDTIGVIFSAESKIRPVCLPIREESFAGYKGVIIGWGRISNYGQTSDVLQQVDLSIITNDKCNELYSDVQDNITENMMCAGYNDGPRNACHGDSGGPLQIIRNNAFFHIVGIFSGYETACAGTKYPNVYTRVNKYLDWLADKTQDACPCNNAYDPSNNSE